MEGNYYVTVLSVLIGGNHGAYTLGSREAERQIRAIAACSGRSLWSLCSLWSNFSG
jgi:hypothetical protein